MTADIKTMKLYPRPTRIYDDLRALGYGDHAPVDVAVLNRYDQLHYHGTQALDAAIVACGISAGDAVLEVGSGWGGCARYIAQTTRAHVSAVELQQDYNAVAQDLTTRAQLNDKLTHINVDFLELAIEPGSYAHAVSWLALFHIPERARYLRKLHDALTPGGMLFAEDLYQLKEPAASDLEDFENHLFPNSLVPLEAYQQTLDDAGLEIVELTDMTRDWTAFTASRLAAFRDNRAGYSAIHGADGYATIETFYAKMTGYFADGLVGGLRFTARRRA